MTTMEKARFKHALTLRVRNYEVDWQGIVHNGNYLLYCEVGRVEYMKQIGAKVDLSTINSEAKVVLVRNEVNYRGAARFDEELVVRTRVSYIRNTSFAMESLIERRATGEVITENVAYHVWLDPASDRPLPVPGEFRDLVRRFEGPDCEFLSEGPETGRR